MDAIRIAIQGELGSFSHEAALRMFEKQGVEPELDACVLSTQVFERLAAGHVDGAVIPIENSLAGPVAEHYDLLLRHPVRIARELRLRIRHNLIGPKGMRLDQVECVSSHPVALAQCGRFLAAHPNMKAMPYYDTAGSVKQAMEHPDGRSAGIASAQAAVQYGGEILADGIEDNEENYTRFHLIRSAAAEPEDDAEAAIEADSDAGWELDELESGQSQPDKMSLAFAVEHRPGTLVRALELLAQRGVDLTKIDSRPVPGKPWEYVFFVDVRFSSPEMADAALQALQGKCLMVKDLGRYRGA